MRNDEKREIFLGGKGGGGGGAKGGSHPTGVRGHAPLENFENEAVNGTILEHLETIHLTIQFKP